MSIHSMTGILNQIQFQARQASGLNTHDSTSEIGKLSFSDTLLSSINAMSQTQTVAKSQAQAYMSGAPGIELNDVMVSLQKSSLALNLGVQVRNKMVSAYQEIMGMSL